MGTKTTWDKITSHANTPCHRLLSRFATSLLPVQQRGTSPSNAVANTPVLYTEFTMHPCGSLNFLQLLNLLSYTGSSQRAEINGNICPPLVTAMLDPLSVSVAVVTSFCLTPVVASTRYAPSPVQYDARQQRCWDPEPALAPGSGPELWPWALALLRQAVIYQGGVGCFNIPALVSGFNPFIYHAPQAQW